MWFYAQTRDYKAAFFEILWHDSALSASQPWSVTTVTHIQSSTTRESDFENKKMTGNDAKVAS